MNSLYVAWIAGYAPVPSADTRWTPGTCPERVPAGSFARWLLTDADGRILTWPSKDEARHAALCARPPTCTGDVGATPASLLPHHLRRRLS